MPAPDEGKLAWEGKDATSYAHTNASASLYRDDVAYGWAEVHEDQIQDLGLTAEYRARMSVSRGGSRRNGVRRTSNELRARNASHH